VKHEPLDGARGGAISARDGGLSGPLIDAAGLVADGSDFDLLSLSSSLDSDEDRAIADELAAVARIAQAHRKLHQVLPQPAPGSDAVPFAASWGHLDLIEVVGRGSYGTVYRAWDSRLDRQVALKLFHCARNPETVMQEGRMLARIRHENVVTVYGADVYNGIAGIWMEFVHGRRLDQIIEQAGAFDVEETTRVGIAVCRALVAVHGAGLLHCDVKAQNVIREQGGRIVLMDLGAGRETFADDDCTSKLQVAGTPRYMAPEVFDRGSAIAQSDVYSVGVLLFYLSTGRFPVDGKTLSDIRRAHLEARRAQLTDYRPDLPGRFVKSVSRAIDPTPTARHATPGELETDLVGIPQTAQEAAAPRPVIGFKTIAASIALVVTLTGALAWKLVTSNAAPAAGTPLTRSLAVLPIKNLTGDASKGYLAEGLTEVFISNFAGVNGFRVPSSTAVAPFRSSGQPSSEIAQRLGVDLLLAGSLVQESGNERIVVQLIEAASDSVLWSAQIMPGSRGLLSVAGDLAHDVARRLSVTLTDREARTLVHQPIDPAAQEAYLKGLASAESALDLSSAVATIEHFKTAVELAPDYAPAWAKLAESEIKRINFTPSLDRASAAAVPREQALRAITLDDDLSAGYRALGRVQFYYDWDFDAAERTLRKALSLTPSDTSVRFTLAMLLAALQRTDEAIAIADEARQLEPLVPGAAIHLGTAYYYARQYDRAEAEFRRLLDFSPGNAVGYFGLGRVYSAQGRHDDAMAQYQRALGIVRSPGYLVEYARALTAAGRTNEAAATLEELRNREAKGEGYNLDHLAYIAAAGGRFDEAFSILDTAADRRQANMLWLAVDPRGDALRSDARFGALLTRMGLRP
jgi:serine/threonine-protein kinase